MLRLKKAAVFAVLICGTLLLTACPSQTNIAKINGDQRPEIGAGRAADAPERRRRKRRQQRQSAGHEDEEDRRRARIFETSRAQRQRVVTPPRQRRLRS